MPPLRERREDIALLCSISLQRAQRNSRSTRSGCPPEALAFISDLSFPGNVRQLENLCHWLTVLAPAQVVKVEDLPLEVRQEAAAPRPRVHGVRAAGAARNISDGPSTVPAQPIQRGQQDWLAHADR